MKKINIENPVEPKKENIVAIIVTYFPDNQIVERVSRIASQVGAVIIINNNSSDFCREVLNNLSINNGVHLILNESNLGVATALNIGINYAHNILESCAWCLTLDQDTFVYPDLVSSQISAYYACNFKNQGGLIGSNYQEWTTNKILFTGDLNNKLFAEVENLPTSGSLTSLVMFKHVGEFQDNLFIDYVDTEFCLRVKKFGFRVIIVPQVTMRHPLGYYKDSKLYKFISGKNMVSNYPPMRHYYWTRNAILLSVIYFNGNKKWSISQLYYVIIKRPLLVILFEDEKWKKIKNIIFGFVDALQNRLGRRDNINF